MNDLPASYDNRFEDRRPLAGDCPHECGGEIVRCQEPDCAAEVCEHLAVECASCWQPVCPAHQVMFGGGVWCVSCIAAYGREAVEELAA